MASSRPTILQVIPSLDTGGAELSTLEIAEAITLAGGRALVASQGGRLAQRLRHVGGELIELPVASKNPVTMLRNARRIADLIGDLDVDLVHARSRAPAWSSLWAARRTRCPFVTTYHGAYGERGPMKRLYNSVMARGDVVIANSRYTADLIQSRYATARDRVRVIYRGVPVDIFDPDHIADDRIAALRQAWGTGVGDLVILHAARVTRWKGHADVIEAVAELHHDHPDLVVIMAGDAQGRDSYAAELKKLIDSRGLRDRVRLVGHCADMPAAFALARVAVVASTEPEAFGRAAAEAQAMGCPVISTNIGAPPETVRAVPHVAPGAETGWLVPPANPRALAAALRGALQLSTADRGELGRRARAHVRASFTTARMQSETLAVYDQLLGCELEKRFLRAAAGVSPSYQPQTGSNAVQ